YTESGPRQTIGQKKIDDCPLICVKICSLYCALMKKCFVVLSLAAVAAIVSGCASSGVKNPSGASVTEMRPDERGFVAGTGIESQDIVTVAEKMARAIVAVPEIANRQGVPRVVVLPVKNESRFPIYKDILLEEIMSLLNESSFGLVRFLACARMSDFECERAREHNGQ